MPAIPGLVMPTDGRQTIIEAPGRWPRLALGEMWRYRSIARVLASRNLKVRYRQTVLGIAWVLIQPLSLMLVFSIFFGLLARQSYFDIPYPVFFLCAIAIWLPTLKVVNEGTLSLSANQQLVTRVYVPRALIPFSVAIASLVDLGFMLLALGVTLLIFGFMPLLTILSLPLLILIAYLTGLGIAYWFAAINVEYHDVQVGLPFFERMWFFLSPILYPAQIVPEAFQPLFYLNPMAVVMTGLRWALAGAPPPPLYAWVEGIVVSVLLLVTGYLIFQRREPTFADVL